ncbi:MAG: hypothetical protein M3R68_05740 [Acidobacteriota bacterium]|nr:hypothetical protein [Acidobacteriota bacterium]
MKRVLLVVALVIIAAIAGIVRSHTRVSRDGVRFKVSSSSQGNGELRDEIRKSFELSPAAEVSVSGINGSVTIETADTKTAEVYVERIGKEAGALERRKIVIEGSATRLTVRGEKGDVGFFDRLFGSNPTERVTLKLPTKISLMTSGVNGSVTVGDIDGAVEVSGINGRVVIGQATGSAEFHGINGNISVALRTLDKAGVEVSGVNGNIELRLATGVNADLEAHGMNGSVRSDVPEINVEKSDHGNKYFAHIGTGGNPIKVSGVNGNVRLTRPATTSTPSAEESKTK